MLKENDTIWKPYVKKGIESTFCGVCNTSNKMCDNMDKEAAVGVGEHCCDVVQAS